MSDDAFSCFGTTEAEEGLMSDDPFSCFEEGLMSDDPFSPSGRPKLKKD